jgi:hypothetical protein
MRSGGSSGDVDAREAECAAGYGEERRAFAEIRPAESDRDEGNEVVEGGDKPGDLERGRSGESILLHDDGAGIQKRGRDEEHEPEPGW